MTKIDIGQTKTEFTLSNGNTVLLDTSDTNIIKRFKEVQSEISKMEEIATEASSPTKSKDEIFELLDKLHLEMCEKIDYIFDSKVSTPCCGNANMFDVSGGKFRFERIIEGLLYAYEQNLGNEVKKMQKRLSNAKGKYNV